MKKQILFCFGLHLLLVNILSFPMESNQNQEKQLIIFNQSQEIPVSQRQQNVTESIISAINTSQAGSSSPQTNDLTTHNHQIVSLPDTSALLSDEEAQRFIASAPSPKARIIINMIMTRCFKTSPDEGSLIVSFIGESGTGKTSLIKAIIATLKRPFALIPALEMLEQDQHSVLQHIKNTVRPFLERDLPCVVALDDIDKFYSTHEIYTEKLKPDQLLSYYLDEAKAKDKNRNNPHFIFLTSANEPGKLSDMFSSRSQIVEIGKPDYSSRFQILKSLITKKSVNLNDEKVKDLAQKTEYLSIKDLKELIGFSIVLNDIKIPPSYYLNPPLIEQMLKELLPEKEVKEETLTEKDNTKESSQKSKKSLILEKLGSFIQFVGRIAIPILIQNWLESTPESNQETPETNQENNVCPEDKTN